MKSDRLIYWVIIKKLSRRLNYREHQTNTNVHRRRKENKETSSTWYLDQISNKKEGRARRSEYLNAKI